MNDITTISPNTLLLLWTVMAVGQKQEDCLAHLGIKKVWIVCVRLLRRVQKKSIKALTLH
jgi:hypothetical protein